MVSGLENTDLVQPMLFDHEAQHPFWVSRSVNALCAPQWRRSGLTASRSSWAEIAPPAR
jgi:hypothetical protein